MGYCYQLAIVTLYLKQCKLNSMANVHLISTWHRSRQSNLMGNMLMTAISFAISSCDCQLGGKFPPYSINGYWSRRRKRQEIRKEEWMQCCDDGKGCRSRLAVRGWETYLIESCQYSSTTEARGRKLEQERKKLVMTATRVKRQGWLTLSAHIL
jgi:hypothetical protein